LYPNIRLVSTICLDGCIDVVKSHNLSGGTIPPGQQSEKSQYILAEL